MSRDTALPPGARAQSASRADVAGGTTEFQPSMGHSPAEVVKLPVKHADGPFGSEMYFGKDRLRDVEEAILAG